MVTPPPEVLRSTPALEAPLGETSNLVNAPNPLLTVSIWTWVLCTIAVLLSVSIQLFTKARIMKKLDWWDSEYQSCATRLQVNLSRFTVDCCCISPLRIHQSSSDSNPLQLGFIAHMVLSIVTVIHGVGKHQWNVSLEEVMFISYVGLLLVLLKMKY